jgi:hypothetical protein
VGEWVEVKVFLWIAYNKQKCIGEINVVLVVVLIRNRGPQDRILPRERFTN